MGGYVLRKLTISLILNEVNVVCERLCELNMGHGFDLLRSDIVKQCSTLLLVLSFSLCGRVWGDENPPTVDLAKFFPAQSVAYVEIAKPGELLEDVQQLFGARLAEVLLKQIHDRQDRAKNAEELLQARAAARMEMLFSPALAEELKHVGPIGIAVLELTPQEQARYVCVVALRGSSAMRLMVQNYLSTGNVRRVGVVDGLTIYQQRGFVPQPRRRSLPANPAAKKGENTKPKPVPTFPATVGEMEPTFALMSDYLLIASDRKAIADVQKRNQKNRDGAVAGRFAAVSTACFAAIGSRHFFYGEPSLAIRQLSRELERGVYVDTLAMLNFVVGDAWVGSMAGTLVLDSETINVHLKIETDPKIASPLAKWVRQMPTSAMQPMPSLDGVAWGMTLRLPDVAAQLALLDGIAKGRGLLGQLPSKRVLVDGPIGSVLRRVRSVSLLQVKRGEVPILHLTFDDEATAQSGLSILPQAFALGLNDEEPLPTSSELVAGRRFHSIPGSRLPNGKTLHIVQNGSTIAISESRDVLLTLLQRQTEMRTNEGLARFQFQPGAFVTPRKVQSQGEQSNAEPNYPRPRSTGRYYASRRKSPTLPTAWWNGMERLLEPLPAVKGSVRMLEERIIIDVAMPMPGDALPQAWERYLDQLMQQPAGSTIHPPVIFDSITMER